MFEKKKILTYRIICFALLVSTIILTIIFNNLSKRYFEQNYDILDYYDYYDPYEFPALWLEYLCFFNLMFFICTLCLSCKIYEYNGNEIIVYAGFYHHYIKVNGTKMDEHNTLIYFTPISLSCTLNDGTDLAIVITTSNRISLKINNQLYTKTK